MLMLGLMFFGLLSMRGMGVGQMPDIDFPILNIQITWEGAAPEVMETDVVDIIEDSVMGIEGLKEVSSTTQQGSSNITLEFNLGRDIDAALQETQSKLSEAQFRLPKDIDPAVIRKVNPEDHPIMWVGVGSKRPLRDLMEFVDKSVKDRFKTVPGVGEVFMGGYVTPNLRIWIDDRKMNTYELTVEDIIKAVQSEHVEMPAGQLETENTETRVRIMGEANTVGDFEKITINTRGGLPNYRPILLKEIATIEDGLSDIRRISRVMGSPAVGLGIRKQRGANSVRVAQGVRKRIQEIKRDLPEGYDMDINFDSTRFIEDSVQELYFTLILSALLTSVVCWLFLGSWSSTVNILLAIPTSILGTFIFLKFSNFTLNTFTMLAITLVIGIVVDDAIMVLENIVRHREGGETQRDAALLGAKEISMAALVSTTAIVAIFLPVAFMKGIIGKFFFYFGITITISVMLSLVEALSFAPMRCAQFLEISGRKTSFGRGFERAFRKSQAFYERVLGFVLARKKMVLFGSLGLFILSLGLLPLLRKEFVPAQDQSMLMVRIQTPIGSSIAFTNRRFKEAEKFIMSDPNVKRYMAAIGGFGSSEVNQGVIFITLKQPGERAKYRGSWRRPGQQQIMNRFRTELNKIPDVKAVIQDLSTRGLAAQRGFPIEFSVRGNDWKKLAGFAKDIQEEMKKNDLFQDVDTDYLEGMPEIKIYPNRDRAFQYGVSISDIAQTVNALVAGERVSKYTKGGTRYDVRVRVKSTRRTMAEDITNFFVRNNRGELVKLSNLVDLVENPSLLTITRRGRERAIGIFANVTHNKSQAAALEKVKQIGARILPEGYRVVFSGTSETMQESFQSLLMALVLGIIISYMVLAAQFNHLGHPITVLLALPFSVSGALLALWITNQSLNIYSMIGLLLLMGIVKKNSILLVEFTNQLRERGMEPLEALKTACPIRFRPIIMTSVSTIAAAIPPAMALGPGAETRIPMAIAIIGGVIASTLLSLIVVPCAYQTLTRLEMYHKKAAAVR